MLIRKAVIATASLFGGIISVRLLMKLTGKNVIFPFYHAVSDGPLAHIQPLYHPKTTKEFTKDLDFLLKHYVPMDINEVISFRDSRHKRSKPWFFLSFDDGLKEFYEIIAPILLKKGIPAACFLNTSFIDNKDLFYRYKASLLCEFFRNENKAYDIPEVIQWGKNHKYTTPEKVLLSLPYQKKEDIDSLATILGFDFKAYLEREKPYMTRDQISELSSQGFYFGAHSMDHPMYGSIDASEQIRQTEISLRWLKENLGQKCSMFAFPFSDHGVKSSFYTHFEDVDLIFGTAGLKNTSVKNHFQRIAFESAEYSGETITKGEYLYYVLKSMVGKNQIIVHD
jgi:peptidoglycan/xylan/chitin deacetylase (PgdA/CDA1 family)